MQWAMHGATVCYRHGGQLPVVRRKAARVVAQRKAEERAKGLGVNAPDGDWVGALKLALARQRDLEETLMERVQEIDAADWRMLDAKRGEQLHALVDAYRVTLRDLRDTAVAMARIDIEAFAAQISERQADAMHAVIEWLLAQAVDAGMTREQKDICRAEAGTRLRALRSGAA